MILCDDTLLTGNRVIVVLVFAYPIFWINSVVILKNLDVTRYVKMCLKIQHG